MLVWARQLQVFTWELQTANIRPLGHQVYVFYCFGVHAKTQINEQIVLRPLFIILKRHLKHVQDRV